MQESGTGPTLGDDYSEAPSTEVCSRGVAGPLGFEPRVADLEAAGLAS